MLGVYIAYIGDSRTAAAISSGEFVEVNSKAVDAEVNIVTTQRENSYRAAVTPGKTNLGTPWLIVRSRAVGGSHGYYPVEMPLPGGCPGDGGDDVCGTFLLGGNEDPGQFELLLVVVPHALDESFRQQAAADAISGQGFWTAVPSGVEYVQVIGIERR